MLMFITSTAYAGNSTINVNQKHASFQVSRNPVFLLTQVKGHLTAHIQDINVHPTTVSILQGEESKLIVALAFLGILFSVLGIWGVAKNMMLSIQTFSREDMFSVKFLSEAITSIVLLIILLYSINVVVAYLSHGEIYHFVHFHTS